MWPIIQRDNNQALFRETKTNSYSAHLIILITMNSVLKFHLKPGTVSIMLYVCHSLMKPLII